MKINLQKEKIYKFKKHETNDFESSFKEIKTNNFTTEEDEETAEVISKNANKTIVIDDLQDDEKEIQESVDHIKFQTLKIIKFQKLQSQFEKIQKLKSLMLAVIKARPIRKHYIKIKQSVRILQKHFKIIITKRIKEKKIKNEVNLKKLRQQQFIAKQREAQNKRKLKKKAVLVIEKYMYKKIIRMKYRELRKKLAKIPKELRIVYFKYMALRSDTNILVNQYNDVMPSGLLSPTNLLIE